MILTKPALQASGKEMKPRVGHYWALLKTLPSMEQAVKTGPGPRNPGCWQVLLSRRRGDGAGATSWCKQARVAPDQTTMGMYKHLGKGATENKGRFQPAGLRSKVPKKPRRERETEKEKNDRTTLVLYCFAYSLLWYKVTIMTICITVGSIIHR